MVEMSQDVFDFFMIIGGIVLTIITFIIGFWVLDRSRRETPFYMLGYAQSAAWAGRTAQQIMEGEQEPMPLRVKDLEKMAAEKTSEAQKLMSSKAESQVLKTERDKLKQDKETLEQLLKDRGITPPD